MAPVLMLLATAVLILLPHLGVQVPNLSLIWLGLTAAAAVIILLRWLTLPDDGGLGEPGLGNVDVDAGAGFGLIIGLIIAIASAVVAFLNFRASPKMDASPQAGPTPA